MSNPLVVLLLNHLWQSTLILAGVWGLTRLLRGNSPRVRYILWLAASLKFLVPFALVAAISAHFLAHPESGVTEAAAPILDVAGNITAPLAAELPLYRIPDARADAGLPTMFVVWVVMALVWAAGALFVTGRWLLRWLEVRRALRDSVALTHIDFPAPVRATAQQFEPGVVGIFRPKLLLPAGIEERLTPEQMRAVLAHERCHLRWRDNFTVSLHMLVEAVFWYFPPVWWIGTRLIEEREKACDEQVIRDGHAPQSYAEGILSVCEHYIASRLPCVSGVSGADLRKRIESIVRRTLGARLDGPRKLALAATVCCTVAAPVVAGMFSGNTTLQLLISAGPATTAMERYFLLGNARIQESMAGRSAANPSAWSCPDPDPGAAILKRQKALAALVAKLPARHDKALLYAVAANSRTEVKRLLAAGAPRNGDDFLRGDTLMHIAAEFADVPMMKLLADAGIGIDGRNAASLSADGRTPLLIAISTGHLRNARWLLEHGADASAIDKYKQSALTLAMSNCHDRDLVALLVKAGARPEIRALRIADNLGFDLRTDPARFGPPMPNWIMATKNAAAVADFDGDGRMDQAVLAMSIDGRREAVFVWLFSQEGMRRVKAAETREASEPYTEPTMAISVTKPGTYASACSKGYGKPCAAGESELVLKHSGIDFSQSEGASSILYWDDASGMFKQFWTSD